MKLVITNGIVFKFEAETDEESRQLNEVFVALTTRNNQLSFVNATRKPDEELISSVTFLSNKL